MALADFERTLRYLYDGSGRGPTVFRVTLLTFDLVTIGLFMVLTFIEQAPWIIWFDVGIAIVLSGDYVARFILAHERWRFFLHFANVADLIVISSLFAAAFVDNLGFLRILRAFRLLRSYHILGMLTRRHAWVRKNHDVIVSTINLLVFIFVVTAVVFVTQDDINPGIENYIDALYFTIATLTTTGFGDITLVGDFGHLISVLIMVFGISLFIRLVQTVFRPARIRQRCKHCGLSRHDPDAVHCKHCGNLINIPTEGAS